MNTKTVSEQALQSLGLDSLTAEEREEVLGTMGELIFKDSLVRCLEAMPPEDRDAFAKLASSGASPDDIASFVAERVPAVDKIVADVVNDLSDDILSVTK